MGNALARAGFGESNLVRDRGAGVHIGEGHPGVIGYVDNHGSRSDRVVDPLGLEGGRLTAHDHRADDTRVFAVHRITSVRSVG